MKFDETFLANYQVVKLQRDFVNNGEGMISPKPLIGEPTFERITVTLKKPQAVKDENRLKSLEYGFKRLEKVYPVEKLMFHCSVSTGAVLLAMSSKGDLSFFSGLFSFIYILFALKPAIENYVKEEGVRKRNHGFDNPELRAEHSRLVKSVFNQKEIIDRYYQDLSVHQKKIDEENAERARPLKEWWTQFHKQSAEYEFYLKNQKAIDRKLTYEMGADVCEKNITKEWIDEQRNIASRLKKKLEVTTDCPYCGDPLGRLPHGDHIIPVTSGGKSVMKNMVNVCNACNTEKGVDSLKEFCSKSKHARPYKEIKAVLIKMGKKVIEIN